MLKLKRRPMVGQLPKKAPPKPPPKTTKSAKQDDEVLEDASQSAAGAPARPAIKIPQILAELEEACKHLGIRLTYEAIGGELGSGGLCKVKGKWRAIFDKRTTPAERVTLLLPLLSRFPVGEMPLSEPVRELVLRMQRGGERSEQASEAAHAAQ